MRKFLCFALRKFVVLLFFLAGITLVAFLLGVAAPGDPALAVMTMDGITEPTVGQLAVLRHEMGLDLPLYEQYIRWLLGAALGDFGTSYITGRPVLQELVTRFPVTFKLSVCALGWVVSLGIPLGLWSAMKLNKPAEIFVRFVVMFFLSVPGFWLAIILIMILSEELTLLPSSGYGTFRHWLMPSFVLAAGSAAAVVRVQKVAALEVMEKDFVLTERAKGLPWDFVIKKHVFPNALMPVITMLGTFFGAVLGGSVIVEDLFSLPGIGSYVLSAVWSRDYPVIQGYVVVSGTVFVVFNYLVDMSYYLLNPLIRIEEKR